MKTTIEISGELMKKAKALAAKRGTTLKSLLELSLRNTIADEERARPYRLPDKSVAGKGLQPGFAEENWADIRSAAYEGRGG